MKIGWNINCAVVGRVFVLCGVAASGTSCLRAQTGAISFVPGISRPVGTGTAGSSGVGGQANVAAINGGRGVVVDTNGNLFFADTGNSEVKRVDAVTGILTIYAGGGAMCATATDAMGDGCPATQATLKGPYDLTLDGNGNLFVSDSGNNLVREVIAQTGVIVKVAGGGTIGTGQCTGSTDTVGDGCLATQAALTAPEGVAVDKTGNVYIADSGKNLIRKINAQTGSISKYVGTGTNGETGDGGAALSAKLAAPAGITLDASGNLYIADKTNGLIRFVTAATGIISTVAGTVSTTTTPVTGYSGDGGAAISATLDLPTGVSLSPTGALYIADYGNNAIRVVNPSRIISTYAGAASIPCAGKTDTSGDGCAATQAKLIDPYGVATNAAGDLYIGDFGANQIRKVSFGTDFPQTAVATTQAVSQNLYFASNTSMTPASVAIASGFGDFTLGSVSGCTLGTAISSGTPCTLPATFNPQYPGLRAAPVVVTDSGATTYQATAYGIGTAPLIAFSPPLISTIAGTGVKGLSGNGTAATAAMFSGETAIAMDSAQSVYIADTGNSVVRKIDGTAGTISTIAGTGVPGYSGDNQAGSAAQLNLPGGVALDAVGNRILIADTNNNALRALNAQGIITTLAGNGTAGYTGDGLAAAGSQLNSPSSVAADIFGNVYIADQGNNAVRRISRAGVITTLAGNGTAGYTGDGQIATSAELNAPSAVAVDLNGDVYIADGGNSVIREVSAATGLIATVAGSGGVSGYSGDGQLATQARLGGATVIGLDPAGNLYIADTNNDALRFVSAQTHNITTLAGGNLSGYMGDGGSAAAARLSYPSGLALNGNGNLLIADTGNNVVRTVSSAFVPSLSFGVQAVGTTSSPQTLTVTNIGNAALTFSGIAVSSPFSQKANANGDCSTSTPIAAGASCTVSVVFTPVSNSPASGTLTLADNQLNQTATQTIPLLYTNPALATSTTLALSPATAPISYGNTLQLISVTTASASNTAAYSGTVIFNDGATQVGTATIGATGTATLSVTPVAGSHSFTANYLGDANHGSSQSAVAAKLLVTQATTALTLSASSTSVRIATPVTLTATVIPALGGTPSGTVTFSSGGLTLGSMAVAQGTASLVVSTLLAGSNVITADYSGDTNFQGSTSSGITVAVVIIPDFAVTATPSLLTIPAGNSGIVTLAVTPSYNYAGTIAFSCGALPANVVCNFLPTSLTATGSGNVLSTELLITTGGSSVQELSVRPSGVPWPFLLLLVPGTLLILRKRGMYRPTLLGVVLVMGALTTMVGCGGMTVAPVASTGTTNITVTAAGSTGGMTHTASITVAIQ
jgi:hypothetical protein